MTILKDLPIDYIERTEKYYLALGYNNPYTWANFNDIPFVKLRKPLFDCRISLVTTAAPYQTGKGDQGPGAPYNAKAKFHDVYSMNISENPDVRISHIAIDRDNTTAVDNNTWFPLVQLNRVAAEGRIGSVSDRFHGFPTNRSQRKTQKNYCPDLLQRIKEDGADAVVLVPNCPVCHQSLGMAARYLEQHGIPTVIMGSAKDIIERVGVPRFLFSDFPLGNSAGKPNDIKSQEHSINFALELFEAIERPPTYWSPLVWANNSNWKSNYSNAENLTPEEILEARIKFDQTKAEKQKLAD